jgi:hypothetical protein
METVNIDLVRGKLLEAARCELRKHYGILEKIYEAEIRREIENESDGGPTQAEAQEAFYIAYERLSATLDFDTQKFITEQVFDALSREWFNRGYKDGLLRAFEITGYSLDDDGDLHNESGEIVEKQSGSKTPDGWPGWTLSGGTMGAKKKLADFADECLTDDLLVERLLSLAEGYAVGMAADSAESVSAFVKGKHDGEPGKCKFVISTMLEIFARDYIEDAQQGRNFQKNMLSLVDQYVALLLVGDKDKSSAKKVTARKRR